MNLLLWRVDLNLHMQKWLPDLVTGPSKSPKQVTSTATITISLTSKWRATIDRVNDIVRLRSYWSTRNSPSQSIWVDSKSTSCTTTYRRKWSPHYRSLLPLRNWWRSIPFSCTWFIICLIAPSSRSRTSYWQWTMRISTISRLLTAISSLCISWNYASRRPL